MVFMNRCTDEILEDQTQSLEKKTRMQVSAFVPFFTKPFEYFKNIHYFHHWVRKCKQFVMLVHQQKTSGARYAIKPFVYEEKLSIYELPEEGVSSKALMKSLTDIVDGSIQCYSENAVYNMVPSPLLDCQAAASMMQLFNINAIMDTYGGRSLLFEQQIARSIGKLINWPQANGLSCNGGKVTLFYALKQAIERIAPESSKQGIPKDLVILASEKAHYSIEHCCSLVGLGSDQCIRIPAHHSESFTSKSLETVFETQLKSGKRIAAIICCGGTTLDFICDDTTVVAMTCSRLVKRHQLKYQPYLHFDSVIGWLWFPFFNNQNVLTKTSQIIKTKIQSVIKQMTSLHCFDSMGVDFHKNGLCPYPSSFFIAKHLPVTYEVENNGDIKSKVFGECERF
jgi:glutamate/tyrosine decarboxylase-like PLP-dependent enzyme